MKFISILNLLLIILLTNNCATIKPGNLKNNSNKTAQKSKGELKLHLLNVGNATCNIVDCPGPNAPILIVDCGMKSGRSENDMAAPEVFQYTHKIIGKRSKKVIISHPDQDHISLIPKVVGSENIESVWLGGNYSDYISSKIGGWIRKIPNNKIHHGWEPGFHNEKKAINNLSCGNASSQILTVNKGYSKNSKSLVLRISYGKFSAIFAGDAEGVTEQSAINNFGNSLNFTTLLTASHHGAKTKKSNSSLWALTTLPKILVFSAGTHKGYKHPDCSSAIRYSESLDTAEQHQFECFKNGEIISKISAKAQYNTETTGKLIVVSDGTNHRVKVGQNSSQESASSSITDQNSDIVARTKYEKNDKPNVKKSNSNICHSRKSSRYYVNTYDFTSFKSLEECFSSDGHCPKNDKACLRKHNYFKKSYK